MNSRFDILKKISAIGVVASIVVSGFSINTISVSANEQETQQEPVVQTRSGFNVVQGINEVKVKQNKVDITYNSGEKMQLTFINSRTFRMYLAPEGEDFKEFPNPTQSDHKATIIVDKDEALSDGTVPSVSEDNGVYSIATADIKLEINTETKMKLMRADNSVVWEEEEPLMYKSNQTIQTLKERPDEYFFGGGTQNGRFSHKGKSINIKNENNWVDQGVASPNPYYWSTAGYGVVRNTFKPGVYDFGSAGNQVVSLSHDEKRFDAYFFVAEDPQTLFKQYYELTGNPVELPEYASYLGHLNCYNRDYWVPVAAGTPGAVKLGENWYKESQTNNGGEKESLLGPGDLTAQKIIQEHKDYDMPLGWFLPNDGYQCNYGQTDTFAGDLENLRDFASFAKDNGIRTGLWTQNNLWPKDINNPQKGERDIYKEVEAGVDAVKTDVAWVGPGYSFGLNGISVAYDAITKKSGHKANIVTLDGWAGTQRYAGIWTGDQTGGKWEYIRFHIPTYIGTSMSGQPNVGSDMDGIFGGKSPVIATRDFQWKAFTTYMLDMDGWGSNQKSPWVFGEDTTSINRAYLKLKAQLQPYNNSISHEATALGGLPMLRAMMLEEQNAYTLGTPTQYQYMWGDNFVVAPIYQDTSSDAQGNDIRNNIYLPGTSDIWIDYFSGEQYRGGQVLNEFDAPIWKLPLFVRNGSILPRYAENNNPEAITSTNKDGLDRSQRITEVFPYKESNFTQYENDGITLDGTTSITEYSSKVVGDTATITIEPTTNAYAGMVSERSDEFLVHVSKEPTSVDGYTKVDSLDEYNAASGKVYFYEAAPSIFVKDYASEGSSYESTTETTTALLHIKDNVKHDITSNKVTVIIRGFENNGEIAKDEENAALSIPTNLVEVASTSDSITIGWDAVTDATQYDVEFTGQDGSTTIFATIKSTEFTKEDLEYKSDFKFRVRAVNLDGYSQWSQFIELSTLDDPYRNVPEAKVTWTYGDQWGGLKNAFDHSTETMFHSTNPVTPEQTMQLDFGKAYKLDKFEYIPRNDNKGNGTVNRMDIYASLDGNIWSKVWDGAANSAWTYDKTDMSNLDMKTVDLSGTSARYLKLSVLSSTGGFFSAAELTTYKVDGDNGFIVGDVNNSGAIDDNDLEFFVNYAGLNPVDNDWDYVSSGDININKLIDAYDVAYVASQLGNPVKEVPAQERGVDGAIELIPETKDMKAGLEYTIDVYGAGFKNVYAFNINFDANIGTYTKAEPTLASGLMRNYSKIRTHSDNTNENIVLFSNTGDLDLIQGTQKIATLTIKPTADVMWDETTNFAMVVGKDLSTKDALSDPSKLPELPETAKKVTPEDGIASITFTNSVISDSDGATLWQQDNWKKLLFDGVLTNNAEFKWITEASAPTFPEEIKVPTDFNITLDNEMFIKNFKVTARKGGNGGLVTSKLVAYNGDDVVYTSNVESGNIVDFVINKNVTKLVFTPLTTSGNANYPVPGDQANRMLTLNEIEIYQDQVTEVSEIVLDESNSTEISLGQLGSFAAKVLPDDASNPYYTVSSSDPSIIEVIEIPTTSGKIFALKAVAEGEATITATADGNPSISASQTVTVINTVDTLLLKAEITKAEAILAEAQLYTDDTITTITSEKEKAEQMLTSTPSQNEVDAQTLALRVALASAKYKGSNSGQASSTDVIAQGQMQVLFATSEADSDYKENIIDGDSATIWHSSYQSAAKLPVEVIVDLGTNYELEQINYLARQTSANGHITKYRVEVSLDNETYKPVVVGTFANDGNSIDQPDLEKEIKFDATEARYVKFIALETLGTTLNKYASIAELNFFGLISDITTPVSGFDINIDEVSLIRGQEYQIPVTLYPTGTQAPLQLVSSDEKVISTDPSTNSITAVGVGEAVVSISLPSLSRALIQKEISVKVDENGLLLLKESVAKLKEERDNLTVNPINQVIVDDVDNEIAEYETLIGDPAISDAQILQALEDVKATLNKAKLSQILLDVATYKDIDLSKYDSTTTSQLKDLLPKLNEILADPMTYLSEISTFNDQLKAAKDVMVLLDNKALSDVIQIAKEIDLSLYLDGDAKDAFIEALTQAVTALDATTNAEYASARVKLEEGMNGLASVKLATQASKDEIQAGISELKSALENNKYSKENADKIEEMISKLEVALADTNLLQVDADRLLQELNVITSTVVKDVLKPVDPIVPTEPDKPGKTDNNSANTGAQLDSMGLYIGMIAGVLVLVAISLFTRKKSKEQ